MNLETIVLEAKKEKKKKIILVLGKQSFWNEERNKYKELVLFYLGILHYGMEKYLIYSLCLQIVQLWLHYTLFDYEISLMWSDTKKQKHYSKLWYTLYQISPLFYFA